MKLASTVLFCAIGIIGFFFLGFMHEQVHVQIFKGYGINSTVDYLNWNGDFITTPDRNCPTESCNLAHDINEAVTYPLTSVYLMIFFGFLTVIGLLERELNGKE